MALEKELINGKGVKTTYHRIDSISMVDGIEVTVKSYTDESYRQQEKERESLIERQKEVKEQLEEEMAKCAATPCDVKTTCPDNDPEQTDVPPYEIVTE